MAGLELRNIVKRYGATTVIHDVSLEARDGEFVVFVGPSGCGKSTLLRLISGLERASGGDLLIDGRRVNDVSAAQRGLAMVFQSYALYPHMTVYQNMAFGLENIRTPRAAIDAKVQGAAKLLRLDALLERRPTELSGGQRQRVAIGRAIVREPTIFLFDEPLSNLDAELRVQMRTEITALHERLETTMIYVTHDQVEAMTMADKIVVLRDGRVEQIGAPLDLYNTPANRFVAGFIGSPRMNFLRGTIATTDADGLCLLLDAAAGKPVGPFAVRPGDAAIGARITLGVRPEHVSIASGDDQGIGLPAVIEQIEQLGGASVLYCALASGEKFTAHIGGQVARRPNEHVRVGFRASDGHVFRADGGEAALERMERSATGSAD